MRHGSKSLNWGVFQLGVAGMLIVVAASASAREPTAPTEPRRAPAEPAAPQEAKAPTIFQPAWEIVVEGKAEVNGLLELV